MWACRLERRWNVNPPAACRRSCAVGSGQAIGRELLGQARGVEEESEPEGEGAGHRDRKALGPTVKAIHPFT